MVRQAVSAGLAVILAAGRLLAGAEPVMSQDLGLKKGWNLFTLKVTPSESASAFFAGWPLTKAGEYDGDAARETVQYSAFMTTEGAISDAWRLYVPGNPDITTLTRLSANKTYLAYLTNAYSTVVWGAPVAARNALHATSSNVLNFVQVTLQNPTDKVMLATYFDGLGAGKWTAYDLYGDGETPKLMPLTGQSKVTGDKTLAITCDRASDWSGPLYVAPRSGIDFGEETTVAELSVRNDTSVSNSFRLTLSRAHTNATEYAVFPTNFYLREEGLVGAGTLWRTFSSDTPFERDLAAGETASLKLAFNRAEWTHLPAGTLLAGLIRVDELGGTCFRTTVPVTARAGGGAVVTNAWPNGIWLVRGSLNAVSYVKDDADVTRPLPAKGTMPVRLLLQRCPDGSMALRGCVDDGHARISSSVMAVGSDVIEGNVTDVGLGDDPDEFGKHASFTWRVSEMSTLNPFYHARHPDHDGLETDFKTRLPSGDNYTNYVNTVKPELFSIDNTVELEWAESEGASWNPEETLSGTLTWRFGGLRRQGELKATGTFTMQRLSAYNPPKGK